MELLKYFFLLCGIVSVSTNWIPSTAKSSLSFANWSGEKCDLNTNLLHSNSSLNCFEYCVSRTNSRYNFGKCYLRKNHGECECVFDRTEL